MYVVTNPLNNRLSARTRGENFFHASVFERDNVILWNDPSAKNGDILSTALVERLHDRGEQGHMCTRKYAQANGINIFLHCGLGYHLRRLVQTSVDHFKSGIT